MKKQTMLIQKMLRNHLHENVKEFMQIGIILLLGQLLLNSTPSFLETVQLLNFNSYHIN